ncbi:MAG: AbrB/MazE/SpoVT family DNA-binding domain-containing protein [Succinatimonas sp.]|nr:AbrB/MazE/SpoVT family DNA-binding domain-containing protein [Succinatimonas sp.]
MKLFKKVNKAGGITIPQQFRHALNIPKGSAVEMEDAGDKIIIKKHIPTCLVCGTADHVNVINGVEICEECAKKFTGGIDHGYDN